MGLRAALLAVSDVLTNHFYGPWTATLVAAVAWGLSRRGRDGPRLPAPASYPRPNPRDAPAITVFLAVVALRIVLTFYRTDLGGSDYSVLSRYSLRGVNHPPPIRPWLGRFFPLGHQEWNLLRFVAPATAVFHVFAVLQMLATLTLLYVALRELRPATRLLALTVWMLTPGFGISFGELIYPERNVLLLLAVLICCVQWYDQSHSPWPLVWGLVATQLMLYYKEPAFLLVLGFATVRLWVAWRVRPAETRSLRALARERPLETGMVVLAGICLAWYAGVMLPYRSMKYATTSESRLASSGSTALAYLRSDPLLTAFVGAVVWRAGALMRGRERPDGLWDALAAGALLYAAAYVLLRMHRPYYMAPADEIAILWLARLVASIWERGRVTRLLVAATVLVVAVTSLAESWLIMRRRKNVVQARVQVASFLRDYTRGTDVTALRLYVPFAQPLAVEEFAALLELKGVTIARARDSVGRGAQLEGPPEFRDGRCLTGFPYRCVHSEAPDPGALIVILPNDGGSEADVARLRGEPPPLFAYQPFWVGNRILGSLAGLGELLQPDTVVESWDPVGYRAYVLLARADSSTSVH